MELGDLVTVTSVLVVGIVSLLAYWIWKQQQVFKTFKNMGLPGPPPSFPMGNAGIFRKQGMAPALMEWGKKYGNLYGVYLPQPTFVVADPEVLRDMMVKKFASFPNRAGQKVFSFKPWKDMMTNARDDRWRHIRNHLSPTFSSGKLKKMMPAIDRVVENLDNYIKEKACSGEDVELKYVAGCFTMDTIAGAAFGMQVDSLKNPDDLFNVNGRKLNKINAWVMPLVTLFPWMAHVLNMFGIGLVAVAPINFFVDIMKAALKDRRKDPEKHSDFLQLLVEADKDEARGPVDAEIDHAAALVTSSHFAGRGLTDDEKISNALIFFLAGWDTTATALSFTLFELAANPQALKKAQDEVDQKLGKTPARYNNIADLTYLDMCMNEAIRLHPPGFIVDREAVEDTELAGYPVKKGTRIIIPCYAMHRDPQNFPEPDKFIPERHTPEAKAARHPFVFIPFGHGPRNCIGMRLAQLEIRLALATLLQHYTPVLCDKSVYPTQFELPQFQMTAKDKMWVKFKPRD